MCDNFSRDNDINHTANVQSGTLAVIATAAVHQTKNKRTVVVQVLVVIN